MPPVLRRIPAAESPIFRCSRATGRPFDPPSELRSGTGRFDDPVREHPFPVVYAASSLLGAYVEVLQRQRPAIDLDQEPTVISSAWIASHVWSVGEVPTTSHFTDVCAVESVAYLRSLGEVADLTMRHGLTDFDLSVITGPYRVITQLIARHIYETDPGCCGLRYISKLGTGEEFLCWAVFADRVAINSLEVDQPLADSLSELSAAASILGLNLDDQSR